MPVTGSVSEPVPWCCDKQGWGRQTMDVEARTENGAAILSVGGRLDAVTAPELEAKVNELIDLLRGRDVLIESVVPHRFSLEEVFMETLGNTR